MFHFRALKKKKDTHRKKILTEEKIVLINEVSTANYICDLQITCIQENGMERYRVRIGMHALCSMISVHAFHKSPCIIMYIYMQTDGKD